jgi:hypothetical protein
LGVGRHQGKHVILNGRRDWDRHNLWWRNVKILEDKLFAYILPGFDGLPGPFQWASMSRAIVLVQFWPVAIPALPWACRRKFRKNVERMETIWSHRNTEKSKGIIIKKEWNSLDGWHFA